MLILLAKSTNFHQTFFPVEDRQINNNHYIIYLYLLKVESFIRQQYSFLPRGLAEVVAVAVAIVAAAVVTVAAVEVAGVLLLAEAFLRCLH